MVEYKNLEVRDRGTLYTVLAFRVIPDSPNEEAFMKRAGYSSEYPDVFLMTYDPDCRCSYDPYSWAERTLHEAHRWIRDNFESINNYDVIDVEYLLGESNTKKESEIWK